MAFTGYPDTELEQGRSELADALPTLDTLAAEPEPVRPKTTIVYEPRWVGSAGAR